MVISRARAASRPKDLPPGTYRVQGVGGELQSEWFNNVTVGAGGEGAKVGLSLNDSRAGVGAGMPQRIPEADVLKASKDAKDLPEGEGKSWSPKSATLPRPAAHRGQALRPRSLGPHRQPHAHPHGDGQHCPTLTSEYHQIVNYLSSKFARSAALRCQQPAAARILTGKAVHYRAVTYDLVNTHAEPHDVAVDPNGNAWVAERAGKLGRFDPKTLEFAEIDPPPGPAAEGSAEPRQSADRRQGHHVGRRRPQRSLAQLRHQDGQVPCLRVARRQRQRRRQQHGAASRRHGLGDRRRQGGAPALPRQGGIQVLRIADRPDASASGRLRHRGRRRRRGLVGRGRNRPDGAHRSRHRQGRGVQDPLRRGTPFRAA